MTRASNLLDKLGDILKTFPITEFGYGTVRNVILVNLEDTGYYDMYYAKKEIEKELKKLNKELGVEFKIDIHEDMFSIDIYGDKSPETAYLIITRIK